MGPYRERHLAPAQRTYRGLIDINNLWNKQTIFKRYFIEK